MAADNYEMSEVNIPREYSFKDQARIQINGSMLDILVTEYTETHSDNIQVSNMLSDSVSMFTYGSMPVGITLEGLIKESKESDHLYDVLKQYKQKWRQRLITDYKKNTKLTIMDTTMNIAIVGINLIKNVDMIGYDTISIEAIAWNYSFPAVSGMLYNYGAEIDLESTFTVDTPTFKFDENSGNKQTEEETKSSITPSFKFDQNSGATSSTADSITPTFNFNPSGAAAFIEK